MKHILFDDDSSSISIPELTGVLDKMILDSSRIEKSNISSKIKTSGSTFSPQRKRPNSVRCSNCRTFHSNKCEFCQILDDSKIKLKEAINGLVEDDDYRNTLISVLIREKSEGSSEKSIGVPHIIDSQSWLTPFGLTLFPAWKNRQQDNNKFVASKLSSKSSGEDFLAKRKRKLVQDEIESFYNQKSASKYFFRDLNDLRKKSVRLNGESVQLHLCPAPDSSKKFKENFDISTQYKHGIRLSKDVSDFIQKNKDSLKNRAQNDELKFPNLAGQRKKATSNSSGSKRRLSFAPPLIEMDEGEQFQKNYELYFK